MSQFEHDSLVVHVRNVNPRAEIHGEDEVLAVDVSVRLMMGEAGTEWDPVLKDLMGGFGGEVDDLAEICERLPFAAKFEDHKVNFRRSNELIATLVPAKVNKFVLDYDDIGITFRIQAEADGETIGKICELIGEKVRLEIVATQGELELVGVDEKAIRKEIALELKAAKTEKKAKAKARAKKKTAKAKKVAIA